MSRVCIVLQSLGVDESMEGFLTWMENLFVSDKVGQANRIFWLKCLGTAALQVSLPWSKWSLSVCLLTLLPITPEQHADQLLLLGNPDAKPAMAMETHKRLASALSGVIGSKIKRLPGGTVNFIHAKGRIGAGAGSGLQIMVWRDLSYRINIISLFCNLVSVSGPL